MSIDNLLGLKALWNPYHRSLDGNIPAVATNFSDWQVVISRERQILDIRQMLIDMPNTRLKPVYSPEGDLTIVVLAESRKAAETRGKKIASRIAEAGLWGFDLIDIFDLEIDK